MQGNHSLINNRLYRIWHNMRRRCYETQHQAYKNYGAKGIGVCETWKQNFDSFEAWALQNGYTAVLTLDRHNNNEGYSPENCHWIPKREQLYNRSCTVWYTVNNITLTQQEWEQKLNCARGSLYQVKHQGKSVEDYILRRLTSIE